MLAQNNRYCHECGNLVHAQGSNVTIIDYSTFSATCGEPGCKEGECYQCVNCEAEYSSAPHNDELIHLFGSDNWKGK